MTTENPVTKYARTALIAQRYAAARQAIPLHIARELQSLEAFAKATFNDVELGRLQRMVANEQQRLLNVEAAGREGVQAYRQAAQENVARALRDHGARILSDTAGVHQRTIGKAMSGDQMESAFVSGKYVIAPHERVTDRVQQRMGKGATRADAIALANQLGELLDDSQAMSRYLDQAIGSDPVSRNAEERRLRGSWMQFELQRRSDERLERTSPEAFQPKEVTLDDSEQRRLAIINEISRYPGGPEWLRDPDVGREPNDGGGPASAIREAMDALEPVDDDVNNAQAVLDAFDRELDE